MEAITSSKAAGRGKLGKREGGKEGGRGSPGLSH